MVSCKSTALRYVQRVDTTMGGESKPNSKSKLWCIAFCVLVDTPFILAQQAGCVNNTVDPTNCFQYCASSNHVTNLCNESSTWIMTGVTNMTGMFSDAYTFNSNISNWEVGNVKDMAFMFYNAMAFNNNISKWDVSNVTTMQSPCFTVPKSSI